MKTNSDRFSFEDTFISKTKSVIVAIVLITAFVFAVYAGMTYPRGTANTPVSFRIGVDSKTATFEQPYQDDKVQVQVAVQNGAALWRVQILSGYQVIWEHSAALGEQQSYRSGWIQLPTGNYNFTFSAIGIGSLDATAAVTSKGGF